MAAARAAAARGGTTTDPGPDLVAHPTGTPTEHFASLQAARYVMESLLLHEIDPSPTSRILARNVVECLANEPPQYGSVAFLEASARWLNGNELCDALGLGRPGLYHWMVVAGQCLFFFYGRLLHLPRGSVPQQAEDQGKDRL